MATINTIIADIASLSKTEKEAFKSYLISIFLRNGSSTTTTMNQFVVKERFFGGLICPLCGNRHIVCNGHRADGVQRYICKDCGRSFIATSNSIESGTRKALPVWEKYIGCMMHGFSVRKSADICGIHRNTSFAWRHKILGSLQNMASSVVLNGIVEADETFFPLSYKGNHTKDGFVMPRKAHKRGGCTNLRGLSHEKVCVPCAVNRKGLSIAKASNLGKVATKDLHRVYDGRIDLGSVVVTDLMNSYKRFANKNGLKLVQLKGGKAKKGIYNIQHINSYHNELKRFLYNFRGVSTKHLDNYLIWHNFVNYAPESEIDKRAILKQFVLTQDISIYMAKIAKKPVSPCAA